MQLPLIEYWRLFTKYLTSPDSYIDMTFYSMIGAALQRRIWIGSSEMPIFANNYTILVGEPGVGKTIIIKPAIQLIKHHKIKAKVSTLPIVESDNLINEVKSLLLDSKQNTKKRDLEDPLLFPMPAEAGTYEELVKTHANCNRYFYTKGEDKKLPLVPPSGVYTHASLYYALEELSSLFCKNADKLVNYLIAAWDCGDYTYATKHQGIDRIRNPCLSLLAGTTPGFMREAFNDKLINEGFSARCLFIFEEKNRFERFQFPDLTPDQFEAKVRVLARLKFLSEFFGQVSYSNEALKYFEHYFEKILPEGGKLNNDYKLVPYYSRKKQHAQKLALAIHFADSDNMVIELSSCVKALSLLEPLEGRMHFALASGGKSQYGIATKKIIKFLMSVKEPQSFFDLWKMLEGEINDIDLAEILRYLKATKQIKEDNVNDKIKYTIPRGNNI